MHGHTCIPGDSAAGDPYPTSHDCPPPAVSYIGSLPIGFSLSTEPQTMTARDMAQQTNVFCGFCAKAVGTPEGTATKGPAHPCTADADCTTAPFTTCQQKSIGAFGTDNTLLKTARTISEMGARAGSLLDRAAHASILGSVFCIPPTFEPNVDGTASLGGPGAVSLVGQSQLLPLLP